MKDKTATANFTMSFNENSFKKNKIYTYKYKDENKENVLVISEEGNVQDFPFSEFDILFTLLTI